MLRLGNHLAWWSVLYNEAFMQYDHLITDLIRRCQIMRYVDDRNTVLTTQTRKRR